MASVAAQQESNVSPTASTTSSAFASTAPVVPPVISAVQALDESLDDSISAVNKPRSSLTKLPESPIKLSIVAPLSTGGSAPVPSPTSLNDSLDNDNSGDKRRHSLTEESSPRLSVARLPALSSTRNSQRTALDPADEAAKTAVADTVEEIDDLDISGIVKLDDGARSKAAQQAAVAVSTTSQSTSTTSKLSRKSTGESSTWATATAPASAAAQSVEVKPTAGAPSVDSIVTAATDIHSAPTALSHAMPRSPSQQTDRFKVSASFPVDDISSSFDLSSPPTGRSRISSSKSATAVTTSSNSAAVPSTTGAAGQTSGWTTSSSTSASATEKDHIIRQLNDKLKDTQLQQDAVERQLRSEIDSLKTRLQNQTAVMDSSTPAASVPSINARQVEKENAEQKKLIVQLEAEISRLKDEAIFQSQRHSEEVSEFAICLCR